jgi:4,5:9,10-diseco-3-hydroxy-5,9,17-trioxoandrosta-1(10),2-diene-4-oate hydrolase
VTDGAATAIVPEGKYADIGDGLRVHYQEAGEPGRPVVIFLHGSGPGASGFSNFKGNYPAFAAAGFHVLVPDTLGFGHSSKPDVDYGLDFLAGALRRFTDALGVERAALVGNSHGGALAIQYALDHPETVTRLVLMAPGGLEVRETYMKMEGIRAMMQAFFAPEGITKESLRTVFGLQLADPAQISDVTIEERHAIAITQPKRVMKTLQVPHLAPELGRLACPVLAFWGMQDRFCPSSGAITIASSCKQARVVLLTECGHWVMVEHPDLFNRTSIDFLQGR